MELVVFDLDGTLLNRDSEISDYTSETLKLLNERGIAYTVATGRTLHGSRGVLDGHCFELPQAYKNGVMIWHPESERPTSGATLTPDELDHISSACVAERLTPFVFTLEEDQVSTVYHPPLVTDIEHRLIRTIGESAAAPCYARRPTRRASPGRPRGLRPACAALCSQHVMDRCAEPTLSLCRTGKK